MTQTIQPCSLTILNDTGRNLDKDIQEIVRNLKQLFTLLDNLNNLYEKFNKLNDKIQGKNIELISLKKQMGNHDED
jgi:6-phosphogluconate dehydrogenase